MKKQPLQLTQKDIEDRIKAKYGKRIKVTGKFTGVLKPIDLYCRDCDAHFTQNPDGVVRYKPVCNCVKVKSQPLHYSNEDFVKRIAKSHPNVKLLSPYIGATKKIKYKNLVCGHVINTTPDRLYRSKSNDSGCGRCRTKLSRITPESTIRAKLALDKPHIKMLDPYINASTPIRFWCKKCKVEWISSPSRVANLKYGCASCSQHHTGYARKNVTVNGLKFRLQGAEPAALRFFLRNLDLCPSEIKHGREVPTFSYLHDSAKRIYRPDFFVPKDHRIIEVKSNYTLAGQKEWLDKARAKRRAVISAGYKFTMFVVDKKEKHLRLPRNWPSLPYRRIRGLLGLPSL
jgi:hypothetical protein